jgi:hypothetical protein
MSSFFFVIKVAIVTFFVMALMQVQIGEKSIETHSHQFIIEASRKLKLNEVALGLIKFATEAKHTAENMNSEFWNRSQNSELKK